MILDIAILTLATFAVALVFNLVCVKKNLEKSEEIRNKVSFKLSVVEGHLDRLGFYVNERNELKRNKKD